MSVVRLNRRSFYPLFSKYSKYKSTQAATDQEYVSEPNYPEILDLSYLAIKKRKENAVHEKLKSIGTVEEKMININAPKFYGWNSIILEEYRIPLHSLPFVQHCTRTHFIQQSKLPEFYTPNDNVASLIASQIKTEIEDAIVFEFQGKRNHFHFSLEESEEKQRDDIVSKSVIQQVNRVILNHLAPSMPHLMDAQVDTDPRLESFWFCGGFETPTLLKKAREGHTFFKQFADDPVDHPIQYTGKPALTLRSSVPLEPFVPYSEASNPSLEVPKFEFDPRILGHIIDNRHGTNIPGYWPGDSHEFGLMSYLTRGHILDRHASFGPEDHLETLNSQAVLSSFAWLMAQASHQGFSTYNDVTYPLTTQTIITNGYEWSFYSYQMNTTLVFGDNHETNPLRNICYGTRPEKLFEGIGDNGKLVGFNDDLLKMIIQYYINTPTERKDAVMKPYLDSKVKVVADIEDIERRTWLENMYKYLMSNSPRHKLPYEIYHWEKIYKIDHKTRLMDARKRPFEKHENPLRKRLDDHKPKYIPKAARPDGPKSKKKFENTYYP